VDKKREKEGIPLVKQKKLAKPKEDEGWSLNNIYIYVWSSLATKSLWRITKEEDL